MERKSYYCVCRCTPREGVVSMDARLLDEILDKGWKAINATENVRVIAQKGLILGDLCAGAGYPHRALECWFGALEAVEYLDYDWTFTPLNHRYYRFDSVVSMDECKELGRRIDSLWRRLGHREMAVFERHARHYYHDMWLDKYCGSLP